MDWPPNVATSFWSSLEIDYHFLVPDYKDLPSDTCFSLYSQVCSTSEECKNQILTWWLHALDIIEENKDSSEELLKKIDQTVSSVAASSRPVKISSRLVLLSLSLS